MATFLHAGHGKGLISKSVIGIFDMDITTVSGITRAFLAENQKKNKIVNVTEDIPKSFIIYGEKNEREPEVVISQFSPATLCDRLKRKI